MQLSLWARLGFVVLGIHADVQQRVLRRHHHPGSQQHKQRLPHSHPHGQPTQMGELGGDGAVHKGAQTAVSKVLWGPGCPEDTSTDHQQTTAPRRQV